MRIGILGGGQLARMIIESSAKFGYEFTTFSEEINSPAGRLSNTEFVGEYKNIRDRFVFSRECDIITLENEFIDYRVIEFFEKLKVKVIPGSRVLKLIQDKYTQKETLKTLGIPVPMFRKIDKVQDLKDFISENGYPVILKSRTLGYDGKGNYKIEKVNDIKKGFDELRKRGELMCEEFIKFRRELAVQVVRSAGGETKIYPVVESIQENHICNLVKASKNFEKDISTQIENIARKILSGIDYAGVMGIEFFQKKDGSVMVNEVAPRVHNTGHYTIEGCRTSQFENHIRAILNLPLGSTEMIPEAAVMINILGRRNGEAKTTGIDKLLTQKNTFPHIYGKKETRKGRKMGHITVIADTLADALRKAYKAREQIKI